MLTKIQIIKIRKMVQDDSWEAFMTAASEYQGEIKEMRITGNTAFESLRELHTNQGKVDGLSEFIERIEKLNFID